jgi:hypothetical protein
MISNRAKGFARACRLICGCLLWVGLGGSADAQQVGRGPGRAAIPAAPIYSKDNTVTVYAPMTQAAYRAPVLVFVDRTRDEFQRLVHLKFGSQACPLEIVIGGQRDGDQRVLTARLRDDAGRIRERIELPDPEAADLGRFRRAIFVALLRAWMVDAGGTDATMKDLPAWLIDGVLRCENRETRQTDTDRFLLLWSKACLPVAADLFTFDSLAATREPAVAAVLAGWFLEKHPAGVPFEALLRAAATGTAWEAKRVAMLLSGTDDLAVFDEKLDRWLLSEGRQVVKPGMTTKGIVRRFRSHLLLYPSDYGKTFNARQAGLTFQEVPAYSEDPAVRSGALSKAVTIRMAALGRDGMLLAVSDAYAHFLEAFAQGAKQGELTRLLVEAEGMRKELERRTAQGEVLRRSLENRVNSRDS